MAHHVRASYISLALIFLYKNQSSLISLLFLFRKKARSAYLFECIRTHDGSLSLPPFYESAFGTYCIYITLLCHHRNRLKPYKIKVLSGFSMLKIKKTKVQKKAQKDIKMSYKSLILLSPWYFTQVSYICFL